MFELIALAAGTTLLLWFSRKPIRHPGTHGFYRFFAWEAILALLVLNHRTGTEPAILAYKVASWTLMPLSIVLVGLGVMMLRNYGAASRERAGQELFAFERTTVLVKAGVFGYIRHPMYASLLALAWGAFFEAPSWLGGVLAMSASAFLLLAAKADERECKQYFGSAYVDYMKQTKMFVPFIF